MDELTVMYVYRTCPSVVPDSVGNLIRGDFGIGLSYIEPEAIEGDRMRVVLIG